MQPYIVSILEGKENEAEQALQNFVDEASQIFTFPELAKDDCRKQFWEALFRLGNSTKETAVLRNCFTAIRIISREKTDLDTLVTNEWLDLVRTHLALGNLDNERLSLILEVQKCLCNVCLNCPAIAATCCKNGILQQITERLKVCDEEEVPAEVQFIDVKLVFLLTALCPKIRNKARVDMQTITSLVGLLDSTLKKATQAVDVTNLSLDDHQADLVCEVLKALFNLTLNAYGNCDDKEEDAQCKHLMKLLRIYLIIKTDSLQKAAAIKSNVINLLTNMHDSYYHLLMAPIVSEVSEKFQFEEYNMTAIHEMLVFLQSQLPREKGVSEQYEILSPVVSVLLKGALSERRIRKYLRSQILPPLKDVHTRPEQGSSLRNHLCRLLTTPITQLRDIVAELLFVLCKNSVKRMIKYTGYGNAAGLFAQRGLLGGRSDQGEAAFSSDSDNSETEEYAEHKHGINPVTGCYEPAHPSAMENMTEEQKEYEAMKLVHLIDSLTKCGVIKPCSVGQDGKPHPIDHVLQLQEGLADKHDSDSD